jgi:O-acetyl-ADP-ribose deacetylase (regulator of RNase III)
MRLKINHTEIQLVQEDITLSEADAIVNPANSQLILGGGVAGAIRRRGGDAIDEALKALPPCPVGEAVVTPGGRLKARYVIHAVGPRWGEGDEERKLKSAVTSSLQRADELGLHSVALPAISTGIFGYPLEAAARAILAAVRDHAKGQTTLRRVFLSLFDEKSVKVFKETMDALRLN